MKKLFIRIASALIISVAGFALQMSIVHAGSSITMNVTVVAGPATTSTAPQSLAATPGDAQVSLTWSAPSSTGGSSLTQYLIFDRFTGSSTFAQAATTSASQTTSTITSLTNGQSYDFEVIAQNGVGTSTPSDVASSTPSSTTATTQAQTNGGGGGGGGSYYTPVSTTAFSLPTSTEALQALLAQLEAQLNALLVQAGGSQAGTIGTPFIFARNLAIGMSGNDVKDLQIYLNRHGQPVAVSGFGSFGNEISYFGKKTDAALIKFQKAHGISGSGFCGPITRAYLNSHP